MYTPNNRLKAGRVNSGLHPWLLGPASHAVKQAQGRLLPATCQIGRGFVCACRQEVLVRFWLQSVSRLTSAVWEDASSEALQPFLGVTLEVYSAVMQQRWDNRPVS